MSGVISLDEALVRRRDALDLDDPEYRRLDQLAFENLLRRADAVDLTGLEVWWGNGEYCDGRIISADENGRLLLDDLEDDETNVRVELWQVLCAGWLQEPDDDADPGPDGYLATIRALERREVRT